MTSDGLGVNMKNIFFSAVTSVFIELGDGNCKLEIVLVFSISLSKYQTQKRQYSGRHYAVVVFVSFIIKINFNIKTYFNIKSF